MGTTGVKSTACTFSQVSPNRFQSFSREQPFLIRFRGQPFKAHHSLVTEVQPKRIRQISEIKASQSHCLFVLMGLSTAIASMHYFAILNDKYSF
jgi:hypothetical protein